MTLAPKWIEHLAAGIGNACHLLRDYGQLSMPGVTASSVLTASALAVLDDPEFEALVYERLCCAPTKQIWKQWLSDVRRVNDRDVNKINETIDISSMLAKIGGINDSSQGGSGQYKDRW